MGLAEKINEDMKSAMRAKDKRKLEALRAIKAALLLLKTGKDTSGGEIPESVEIQSLQKLVKQRKEAAGIYRENNKPELAEEEEFQAEVISAYLPEQMSEEDIRKVVEEVIRELGAQSMKDMGRVMGTTSKKLAGKADNKIISVIVKQLLGN